MEKWKSVIVLMCLLFLAQGLRVEDMELKRSNKSEASETTSEMKKDAEAQKLVRKIIEYTAEKKAYEAKIRNIKQKMLAKGNDTTELKAKLYENEMNLMDIIKKIDVIINKVKKIKGNTGTFYVKGVGEVNLNAQAKANKMKNTCLTKKVITTITKLVKQNNTKKLCSYIYQITTQGDCTKLEKRVLTKLTKMESLQDLLTHSLKTVMEDYKGLISISKSIKKIIKGGFTQIRTAKKEKEKVAYCNKLKKPLETTMITLEKMLNTFESKFNSTQSLVYSKITNRTRKLFSYVKESKEIINYYIKNVKPLTKYVLRTTFESSINKVESTIRKVQNFSDEIENIEEKIENLATANEKADSRSKRKSIQKKMSKLYKKAKSLTKIISKSKSKLKSKIKKLEKAIVTVKNSKQYLKKTTKLYDLLAKNKKNLKKIEKKYKIVKKDNKNY